MTATTPDRRRRRVPGPAIEAANVPIARNEDGAGQAKTASGYEGRLAAVRRARDRAQAEGRFGEADALDLAESVLLNLMENAGGTEPRPTTDG
jgi:hypothetical protein